MEIPIMKSITAGSTTKGGGGVTCIVFGLSEENKVYVWDSVNGAWRLHADNQ